jgi:hypothetical protein
MTIAGKTPNRLVAFWRTLSDCTQPRIRYLGRALLADLPIALAVQLVLNAVTGTSWPELPTEALPRLLVVLCAAAPIVETFALGVILILLRRAMTRTEYVPWVAALICAGLHSLWEPRWGLEIFWSSVIFAHCFMAWEKKSILLAFWLTVILHALHNLIPTVVLAAWGAWF